MLFLPLYSFLLPNCQARVHLRVTQHVAGQTLARAPTNGVWVLMEHHLLAPVQAKITHYKTKMWAITSHIVSYLSSGISAVPLTEYTLNCRVITYTLKHPTERMLIRLTTPAQCFDRVQEHAAWPSGITWMAKMLGNLVSFSKYVASHVIRNVCCVNSAVFRFMFYFSTHIRLVLDAIQSTWMIRVKVTSGSRLLLILVGFHQNSKWNSKLPDHSATLETSR